MLGTVDQADDGRFALRFERRLPHPPAKVWRAITEIDHLRVWFVAILDYDRSSLAFADGAALAFVPRAAPELPTGHGHVTRFDPPRLLEYTWDSELLRWELEADGADGCLLVFTNIVDERGTATAVAPGWHAGLDNLTALLAGHDSDRVDWERLQDEYARALG